MNRVSDPAVLTCKQIVELVTEYQSRALDGPDRARFEQHLFACTWCMDYLQQMNRTIATVGSLKVDEPVDSRSLEALFRAHRAKAKGTE
jgi:hypothetical protein